MNDGRDDQLGGDQFGSGATRGATRIADERARAHVRALRNEVLDGGGEMTVLDPPREEMRGNASPAADATPGTATHIEPPPVDTPADPLGFDRHLKPLTARQVTAIRLLTAGKTVVAAARSIGVDPGTVHRWKASSPLFAAELNRRQAALFDGVVTKLRLTMARAVDELHAMAHGASRRERQDAAWRLLPMLRPARLVVPDGATSARALLDARVRAARDVADEPQITDEDRLALVPPEDRAATADA